MSTLVRRTENGLEEWTQDWAFDGQMFWEWRVIPEYRLEPGIAYGITEIPYFRKLIDESRAGEKEVFICLDSVQVKEKDRWYGHHYCPQGGHKVYPYVQCANGAVVPVTWLDDGGTYDGAPVVFPVAS